MKPRLFRAMVGYFSKKVGPTKPEFDPEFPANCAICGEPMTRETVGTTTVRWQNADPTLPPLILFYRVHRACNAKLSRSEKEALDAEALLIGDRISRALKEQGREP